MTHWVALLWHLVAVYEIEVLKIDKSWVTLIGI